MLAKCACGDSGCRSWVKQNQVLANSRLRDLTECQRQRRSCIIPTTAARMWQFSTATNNIWRRCSSACWSYGWWPTPSPARSGVTCSELRRLLVGRRLLVDVEAGEAPYQSNWTMLTSKCNWRQGLLQAIAVLWAPIGQPLSVGGRECRSEHRRGGIKLSGQFASWVLDTDPIPRRRVSTPRWNDWWGWELPTSGPAWQSAAAGRSRWRRVHAGQQLIGADTR